MVMVEKLYDLVLRIANNMCCHVGGECKTDDGCYGKVKNNYEEGERERKKERDYKRLDPQL